MPAAFMRPDFRAGILEHLHAVVVIGVIVAEDDALDRRRVTSRMRWSISQARDGEPRVSSTTTPSLVTTNPAFDMKPCFPCWQHREAGM